jgi:hypothetical protein
MAGSRLDVMEGESKVEKTIKPIETKYNGFRFRSRLEARWAIFFDMIGLKYEYEVEGFEMNGIRYLPDFYIPSLDRWFEIKAKPLSEYEMKKCEEFCFNKDNENIKFSVLVGSPEAVKIDAVAGIMEYVWEWPSEKYSDNVRFLAPEELSEKEYYSRFMRGLWVVPDVTEEELATAAVAAREARFEFGERPVTQKENSKEDE